MKTRKHLDGRWPPKGAHEKKVMEILNDRLRGNLSWGKSKVLGFPSAHPHPLGLKAFDRFQHRHTNAILTHTRGNGEKGFDGVKDLERAVIYMAGDLLGGLGERKVDGYITSGGTEANIMGVWIGREKLRNEIRGGDDRIALLSSPASHYSLHKACALTGIGAGRWENVGFRDMLSKKKVPTLFVPNSDGSGLHLVPCDEYGTLDVAALESTIRSIRKKGVRRFLIFLNEGTTMTGAMDPTYKVGQMVKRLRKKWSDVGFYIHVDAAYGGFIYPFLDEFAGGKWALRVKEVQSMTADPYKMGLAPLAQGIFLCRKNLQQHIQRPTQYVQDERDDTVIGSRSGAHAAACYAVFRSEGWKGFHRLHTQSVRNADYLHDRLITIPNLEVSPRMLNMVSFYLPDDLSTETLCKMNEKIIVPFRVMWALFNSDPTNPHSRPHRLVKCNITKDVKTEWIDGFIKELTPMVS